ncbi:MAG: hypothetical protein HY324_01860, partial [Chlamydiia bacterium]|nr:hypothetical protein [Chlamydiia bacterium]
STDVISKYNLARDHFEEIILLLEFHFVGYLSYRKEEDHWIEVITPFYEWHQYLRFLEKTEAPTFSKEVVKQEWFHDFAFIEEMSRLLALSSNSPQQVASLQENLLTQRALDKLLLTHLAKIEQGTLYSEEGGLLWLEKDLETKALYLYRHPANLASFSHNERQIRDAEKATRRVLHGKWVLFEDFLKGVTVALGDTPQVMIQKTGKIYRYAFPSYSDKEKQWLKTVIFSWLFETGMVAIGSTDVGNEPKDCFCVTSFGRFCFEE